MTLVRLTTDREKEMELVRFDAANTDGPGRPPNNTWVLREDDGSVIALDADAGDILRVEVRCDFCGRWSNAAAPARDDETRWRCWGGLGPCVD